MAKASDQNGFDGDWTKVRGAIRIRYPSSPDCKHCELGVAYSSGICSVEVKTISSPPGKYGRKAET